MNDTDSVKRLVKMLSAFFTEGIAVEEDLTYLLTNEFLRNMQDVLLTKQIVSYSRYQDYFNDKSEEMLSSPENYLQCVFKACIHEVLTNLHTFDRFLNVFAIMLRITIETRLRKGLDFCKLVPDMFMEFYFEELNSSIKNCKGFPRLVEYVNSPRCLESYCIVRNISSFYNPNVFMHGIFSKKAQKMILKEKKVQTCLKNANIDKAIWLMTEEVLSRTNPDFIPVLNDNDLNARASDSVRLKMEGGKNILDISEGDLKETPELCSSLSLDSKINDDAVVQMTNERLENIIGAVIRHNHSKSSSHRKSKGRIQTEAERNLEHMKRTINSLIQVLDEYDKQ